jgi:beta-N-acetylhexosaminidase
MLRDVLGFDGVVVSDALDMAGASATLGIPEAAVQALAAGCDLLCLGPDTPAPLVREVRDAVVAAVADGRLAHDRLADAARRTAALGVPTATTASGAESPDAARQAGAAASAMRVDGDLPDLTGAAVVSVETVANIAVGDVAWGLPPEHRIDPGSLAEGLPDVVPDGVPLVVQVRDAGRRPEVLAFLRTLAASGRPAVVVEWGWPSTHGAGLTTISTRGSSAPGVAAVTQLLRGAGWSG